MAEESSGRRKFLYSPNVSPFPIQFKKRRTTSTPTKISRNSAAKSLFNDSHSHSLLRDDELCDRCGVGDLLDVLPVVNVDTSSSFICSTVPSSDLPSATENCESSVESCGGEEVNSSAFCVCATGWENSSRIICELCGSQRPETCNHSVTGGLCAKCGCSLEGSRTSLLISECSDSNQHDEVTVAGANSCSEDFHDDNCYQSLLISDGSGANQHDEVTVAGANSCSEDFHEDNCYQSFIGQTSPSSNSDEGQQSPESPKRESDSMLGLFERVVSSCEKSRQLLMYLLLSLDLGRLTPQSLTFSIIMETCMLLQQTDTRAMRYSDKTKTFWRLFQIKWGSAPLRYLSGWKGTGLLLRGEAHNGRLSPNNVIIAIPDEDNLRLHKPHGKSWPDKIKPGYCTEVAQQVASCTRDTSLCLSLDGKKVAPGLRGNQGDVDLLGHEPGVSLEQRRKQHSEEIQLINRASTLLHNSPFLPRQMAASIIKILSARRMELEEMEKKKLYALEKLKKDAGPDYRSSKFSYVISLLIATLVEITEAKDTSITVIDRICATAALLNGSNWMQDPPRSIYTVPLYNQLAESNDVRQAPLPFIRQRSPAWFEARKTAVLTGSSLFTALGGDTLKKQKDFYDVKFNGKDPAEPPEEARRAMEHGNRHENCGIATVCCKFLPSLRPDWELYEVGGIPMTLGTVPFISSPDGFFKEGSKVVAALEVKCPYILKQPHSTIPARYYLQVLAEMAALGTDKCLFVSFHQETTRLFQIDFDHEVWHLAVCEAEQVYGAHSNKPASLSTTSKALFAMVKSKVRSNCHLIAEVKSVHVCSAFTNGEVSSQVTVGWYVRPQDQDRSVSTRNTLDLDVFDIAELSLEKTYHLLRQKATELVAFVLTDLDRLNLETRVLGAPVCYLLKGYSLAIETLRKILEDVLNKLQQDGLHVPVVSFDGAFINLLTRDTENQPMTLAQVQKDFWQVVKSKTKQSIINEFKQVELTSYAIERVTEGFSVKLLDGFTLPRTSIQRTVLATNAPQYQETPLIPDSEVPEEVIEMATAMVEEATDTEEVSNCEEVSTVLAETSTDHGTTEEVDGPEDIHISAVVNALQENHKKFEEMSVTRLRGYFVEVQTVQRLTIPELRTVTTTLGLQPVNLRKTTLVNCIAQHLKLHGEYKLNRRKTAATLLTLATKVLSSKHYPKANLNVSYAEWKFPSRVQEWNSQLPHNADMVIPGLEKYFPLQWFYCPQMSRTRQQLEVRRIDTTHLLTRTRSALNRGNLAGARRSHFMGVAEEKTTQLKVGMLEDNLNMQSTDLSLITFSEEVQNQLHLKGYTDSALLCERVREWYKACDDAAIPALERCEMKLRYREMLTSLVDLKRFPPVGSHVQGYPKGLWESLIAAVDADILLYALAKRRTYNQRAVGSQPCEGLFSSLATLPSSHNGTPSCASLESDLGKVIGESLIRLDPDREFPLRLSSATTYPDKLLEKDVGPLPQPQLAPTYIDEINIKDHSFDSRHRRRRAPRKPSGISGLHEPAKGVTGVRSFHKINEGQLNPLVRMGLSSKTSLNVVNE